MISLSPSRSIQINPNSFTNSPSSSFRFKWNTKLVWGCGTYGFGSGKNSGSGFQIQTEVVVEERGGLFKIYFYFVDIF